eukprot:c12089_g1_i1 orf=386-3718(-)
MVTFAHRCFFALHPNCAIGTPARLFYTNSTSTLRRIFSLSLLQTELPLYFSTASIPPRVGAMGADVAAPPVAPTPELPKCTVIKSPSDDREYELVHLPNGLCALLVHDPKISNGEDDDDIDDEDGEEEDDGEDDDEDDDDYEDVTDCPDCLENGSCTAHNDNDSSEDGNSEDGNRRTHDFGSKKKMAAAALAVGIGSFADPKDAQGLFHFLEHMLFMGSSKFPDENEYDSFLSKHGGSSNAFTDTEHTCYYFEVNHKFLKPALDRFSQFFISPLIKAEAMEREVQAVDSEFEGHLQSDIARLSQLQCDTSYEHHPFNCFSWGNRKSLSEPIARGVDMRSKLMEMYNKYYHAGRMKLTVISGESLETLKDWVIEMFGEIRPGMGNPLQFAWEGQVWEPGRLYRIKSVKDQHFVSVIWPFPCLTEAYLKKPYDYISHLVGHEGKGSLFSLLKRNGWATDLSAGVGEGGFERSSAGYMFNVNIYLTDSGLEQVEEVVGLLYQYVKMLRDEGPQEWVHKELQAMTNMEFKFVEEDHADDYVVNLATNMHIFPENHIIYGDFALEAWDPDLVQSLLNLMVPANMRLDIVTKSFDANATDVQHEPWFDFPYTVEPIPSNLMDLWANPKSINPMLHMPVVNEFIPTDFSIRNVESVDVEAPPQVVVDDSVLKLWYKLDKKFQTPRANSYFLISCLGAYDSVKAAVLTELYVKLLKDALNETLYLANVARLESSISVAVDKLEVKLYGFNEKLSCLASKIAHLLKNFVPTAERFEVIKEELVRGYTNTNMKPSKHSTYLRLQILKERFVHVEDKKDLLATLSLGDLVSFIPCLLSQIHIEAFCHGNLLKDEAVSIAEIFKDALAMEPLPNAGEPGEKILKLPTGSSLVYNTDAKNPMEENSAVEMYFQIDQDVGEESVRARAIYDLFESIIYEPCFNELRTKEQLGYNVSCSARMTYRILGFCFRVLSAKYSPLYLKGRIDEFIKTFKSFLDDIDDEEFQNYVDALIEDKLERDHNLTEESDRLWLQIVEKRYLFDINNREAEELKSITKADVINWYKKYLTPTSSSLRKLTICVWGSNARAEKGTKKGVKAGASGKVVRIDNISEFKGKSEYFPALC